MSANNNDIITHSEYVSLGEYIELVDVRNNNNNYCEEYVRGISTSKELIDTKANLAGVSLSSYKAINPRVFVYVADTSRRGEKIALAFNDSNQSFLVSSIYTTFKIKDENSLLPEYLYILLSRSEFDRYSRFNSWGSARETFDWNEMCRTKIPLPSVEVQREFVSVYNGLKDLAEENEALLQPLSDACQAFIVDCKAKYPYVKLGEYIEEINAKNINGEISLTQGVDVNMEFITAKREANDKESTKIVRTGQFAFNKVVKANRTKLPIALRKGPDCIISGSYAVFTITKPNVLLADFLMLFFSRSEFHRYSGYISHGTTRDVFDFKNLCKVDIPLPPLSVQQKVVDLYNCYEEAKKIATQTREQLKTICPAIVQKAAHIV